MAIAAVALGAVVAWYAVGPLLSSPVHVVQQGCPFLDTPAQTGNGLRVRELWNRVYKPPGAHLLTSHGLSVPPRWGRSFKTRTFPQAQQP
jgi:hypothetical protein